MLISRFTHVFFLLCGSRWGFLEGVGLIGVQFAISESESGVFWGYLGCY